MAVAGKAASAGIGRVRRGGMAPDPGDPLGWRDRVLVASLNPYI